MLALFQPHLYSRTLHSARELGAALAAADVVAVADVYPAREAPVPGVTGKLVVDALCDARPGLAPGWTPRLEDGAAFLARRARPGDVVVTIGAGRRRPGALLILDALRTLVSSLPVDIVPPSARLVHTRADFVATLAVGRRPGTPGGANGHVRKRHVKIEEASAREADDRRDRRACARARAAGSLDELEQALAWAAERELPVRPIGLGSNLLAADEGVDALVVRLEGELAAADVEGELLVAGGGAPNAVCLHRARAAGLGGFEFACAIPGTAGGGVRMNAGAYGSDWKAILVRALVVDAGGRALARERRARPLATATRRSSPGRSSPRVEFRLAPRPPAEIKATVAEMQAKRKATQPTNKRTFGSVFKNPDHELGAGRMIEQCGLKGHRIGGALISPRHGNFIENAGGATARGRDRADGRGAAPRARAVRRRRWSARSSCSAPSSCRPAVARGPRPPAANRRWPMAATRPTQPDGHRASPAAARRRCVALVLVGGGGRPVRRRAPDRRSSRSTGSRSRARRRRSPRGSGPRSRPTGRSLVRFDGATPRRRIAAVSEVADATFDRDFPHTLKVRVRLERPVAVLRRGADAWVVSASARVLQQLEHSARTRACPRIWLPAATDVSVNATLGGVAAMGVAAVAPLRPLHIGADVRQVLTGDRELTLVLGTGTELRLGDSGDIRLKLSIAKQILPIANGATLPRRQRSRAARRRLQLSSRRLRVRVSPANSR